MPTGDEPAPPSAPAPYAVRISPAAARDLRGLPPDVRARIVPRIDALASEPRPAGVKKLRASEPATWRIRVGHYRAIYGVDDPTRTVSVEAVRHRGDAYR